MLREAQGGLLAVTLVLVISSLSHPTVTSGQPVCQPGLEFWVPEKSTCSPCRKCDPEFTLSPCAVHQDAVCGPLSALELDWSRLSTRKRPEAGSQVDAVTSRMVWRFPQMEKRLEESKKAMAVDELTSSSFATDDKNRDEVEEFAEDGFGFPPRDEKRSQLQGRRAADEENIPFDWQTGVLVLAVCACIVFFLVAGCSALIYARQWRRMKRNFEPAGLEEISARLNLMVKAELAELTAGAPMSPGDPETRCQYLEKLLDRKRETPVMAGLRGEGGNLYIEEGGTPRSKRAQIAQIHRNIESILNHKANRN